MTRELILVKHSVPDIRLDRPAAEWNLTAEGRKRAAALAKRLAAHEPDVIGASREPKATETAEILARELGKPIAIFDGIHEQERRSLELLPGGKFEAAVAALFAQPEELVFGEETAAEALARFRQAVDRVLEIRETGNIVLVSHGRVISLYVADCTGVEPYPFWRRLGLPSFVVLSLPEQKVTEVVESVL